MKKYNRLLIIKKTASTVVAKRLPWARFEEPRGFYSGPEVYGREHIDWGVQVSNAPANSVSRTAPQYPNSFYWSPTNGSLTDYQYIKCKWLLELLTGSFTSIHKEYGFIYTPRALTRAKISGHWPHFLLGHFFRFYSLFFGHHTRASARRTPNLPREAGRGL